MPEIFEKSRIGEIELQNRLIHSATHECMAGPKGEVTDALIKRYRDMAKGGVGLIIPGFFSISPEGQAFEGQTGIYDDSHIAGLTKLVDEVHAAGGKIVFQLAHGGRQTPRRLTGQPPIAPSSFGRDPASMDKPKAATEDDIARIIGAFGNGARRAQQAGADGVQLHCAHGYLLCNFLSPFFNARKDAWGGSPQNNFRIVREIIGAIRNQTGDLFPILVKLNTNDHTPKPGITPELAAQYAEWLAELGVSGVEISSGSYYSFHTSRGEVPIDDLVKALPRWKRPIARMVFKGQIEPCKFEPLYHRSAAQVIKPALADTPLILVGGVRTMNGMQEILDQGLADFLSMSRPLVREPFLPKRLREGKATEASCTSCNKCFAGIFNGLPLRCYAEGLPI